LVESLQGRGPTLTLAPSFLMLLTDLIIVPSSCATKLSNNRSFNRRKRFLEEKRHPSLRRRRRRRSDRDVLALAGCSPNTSMDMNPRRACGSTFTIMQK